jgi:hypothetical protein
MKRNLLRCGLIAGPLFLTASLTQAFTPARDEVGDLDPAGCTQAQETDRVASKIKPSALSGCGRQYAKVAAVLGVPSSLELSVWD